MRTLYLVQPPDLGRPAAGRDSATSGLSRGPLVELTCRVCHHRFYLTAAPLLRLPRHRRGDNPASRCPAGGALVKGPVPPAQEADRTPAAA